MLKSPFEMLQIQIFICFSFLISSFLSSPFNDCTSLSRECCWRPANDSTAWQKHEGIDEKWYRRVFKSKNVRPPPAQSYYSSILTTPNDHSSLESCSYCSRTGNIKLWIRHWTTSSAQIRLCWRQKVGLRDLTECRDLDSNRSGLIDSEQLSVQRNIPVFFSIQLRAVDSVTWTTPPGALVDFLNVRSELCYLNIQKLKSTRFVLLGGSHLNKQTTKSTTTTLLPLLGPSQPSQSVVDAFFNEDDLLPAPEVETTTENSFKTSNTNKFDSVTKSGFGIGPSPASNLDSKNLPSNKSPTNLQPTGLPSSGYDSPSQQKLTEWQPSSTPWMSARDIDFLVPKVLIPRGNEWTLEQEKIEDPEPPTPAFAVKAPAPLSFSNMLGWPQPTQLPTIDVTPPLSSGIRSGIHVKKLHGAFGDRRQFEKLNGEFDGEHLIGGYNRQHPSLPEPSENPNLPGPTLNPSPLYNYHEPNLPRSSGTKNLHGPSRILNLPGPTLSPSLPNPTLPSNLPSPLNVQSLPGSLNAQNLPGPTQIPSLPGPLFDQSNDPKPTESVQPTQWAKEELAAFKKTAYRPKPLELPTQSPLLSTLPPKLFNPFADLFGEEFADFLDPSFNTSKYDEMELRHEQQQRQDLTTSNKSKTDQHPGSLPIRQLNSKTSKSASGQQKLVTAEQMDGESRQLQHKMSRMERIGNEDPDAYRLRHTTSNPLKLKPPPLVAVHARVFSSPTTPTLKATAQQNDKNDGKEQEKSTTKSEKERKERDKWKATNYAEAKFTRLSWEEFQALKGIKAQIEERGKKANQFQTDPLNQSNSRSPWSVKKQQKKCNYTGGCLFEKSTCHFANSRTLSSNSQFKRVSVGSSNFVEARVGAGDVAVFESRVNVSSSDGFYLLFDYLEWTEGEKLSACCHTPGRQPIELYCPFESSTNERDIRWQSEKIRCEPETQRVLFICENFGHRSGICALDNVRLHAEWDTEFREPCQGDQLALL